MNIRFNKINNLVLTFLIIILSVLLSGCESEYKFLCDNKFKISNGDLELISYQCFTNNNNHDTATSLIKFKDKITNKIYVYTGNVVEGKVVMNLTTSED